MFSILAFDQSVTSTAYALLGEDNGKLKVMLYGTIVPKPTGIYRLIEIQTAINKIVAEKNASMIVREMHNQVQHGAASQIISVGAMIDIASFPYLSEKMYAIITSGSWKKLIGVKGNLKKDTAYLIHINNALKKLSFYSHEREFTNDNIADAVCLAIAGYAAHRYRNKLDIDLTASQVDVLEKSAESMFNYGKKS